MTISNCHSLRAVDFTADTSTADSHTFSYQFTLSFLPKALPESSFTFLAAVGDNGFSKLVNS